MNQLGLKYSDDQLAVLAFPCNQFGYAKEDTSTAQEIVLAIKYVVSEESGTDFEPEPVTMFDRVDVNGAAEHPLFAFLKAALPAPADDPVNLIASADLITWEPVKRTDIGWNYEKFLIRPDGRPYKRYSSAFQPDLEKDIEKLLAEKDMKESLA